MALFIHQMIPHHQNAVNMAKALLKTESISCNDLTSETPECLMETIVREIVSTQNHQIQVMRSILAEKDLPETDDCEVKIASDGVNGAQDKSGSSCAPMPLAIACVLAFLTTMQ